MSTTLLAVDDSVTMRKVLEITFASEDYRFVVAENADAALKKARAEKPHVVLLDVTLPDQDGYALCKALKNEHPGVGVLLLSSKQGPYDAGRGSSVGADEYIDKPFDTQQLLEKVRKLIAAKATQAAAPPPAPPPGVTAPRAPHIVTGATGGPVIRPTAPSMPAGRSGGAPVAEAHPEPPPPPAPSPAPPPAAPQRSSTAPFGTTAVSGATANGPTPDPALATTAVTAANDQMGRKLDGLELTTAQSEAVMAISREVIERVIWEVVPALAETMIREEIRRLMREEA